MTNDYHYHRNIPVKTAETKGAAEKRKKGQEVTRDGKGKESHQMENRPLPLHADLSLWQFAEITPSAVTNSFQWARRCWTGARLGEKGVSFSTGSEKDEYRQRAVTAGHH